jgi:hypothetical protein
VARSTGEKMHHAHLILPLSLWEQLGKIAAKRSKKEGKSISRTALIIHGAQEVVILEGVFDKAPKFKPKEKK